MRILDKLALTLISAGAVSLDIQGNQHSVNLSDSKDVFSLWVGTPSMTFSIHFHGTGDYYVSSPGSSYNMLPTGFENSFSISVNKSAHGSQFNFNY